MGNEQNGAIYFKDGNLVAESGDARVYAMEVEGNKELFLELGKGHTLWAHTMEWEDYVYQMQGRPRGNCLEIGLGLGVASRYILSCPAVDTLTTVEVNEDVIALQKQINPIDDKWGLVSFSDRHIIVNAEGLAFAYETKSRYDFIFIDCYDRIDEETLPIIADMAFACRRLLKEDGEMIGWFDKYTPEEHVASFFSIFNNTFTI
jgi:spermidine synthase